MNPHGTGSQMPRPDTRLAAREKTLHQAADAFMAAFPVPRPDLAAVRERARCGHRLPGIPLRALVWQVPALAALSAGLLFTFRVGPFAPRGSAARLFAPSVPASPTTHGRAALSFGSATPTAAIAQPGVGPSALVLFRGRTYRLTGPARSLLRPGRRLGTGQLTFGSGPSAGPDAVYGPVVRNRGAKGFLSLTGGRLGTGVGPMPTLVYRLPGPNPGLDLLVRIPAPVASALRPGDHPRGGLWLAKPLPRNGVRPAPRTRH